MKRFASRARRARHNDAILARTRQRRRERDDDLLRERLLKESIHELGHTLDLHHCEDYRCDMASSHAVEWIDLREADFCAACQSKLESSGSLAQPRILAARHKTALA